MTERTHKTIAEQPNTELPTRQGEPCVGCGETCEERRRALCNISPRGVGYWCCARCGLPCGSLTKLG